jgi:zinc and cadmium transporter
MTLLAIVLATVLAGVGSVWIAAFLSLGVLSRYTQHMLSLAAGALMATAFMHLLPEAFESGFSSHELFALLLVGLVFFFLLDKAELWHHGHEHHFEPLAPHDEAHDHAHDHAHEHNAHHHHVGHHHHTHAHPLHVSGGWSILTGDSVHCFGDGVLIASAFLVDWRLGILTAVAVLAHEVPHHMGDLVVLRESTGSRRSALLKVSLAGAVTALGGVVGYGLLRSLQDYLPLLLVLASSSFVYVALADLIPQLQKRLTLRETFAQVAWLFVGIVLVTVVSGLAH